MDPLHFTSCVTSTEALPLCATSTEHECALSCLLLWMQHLCQCNSCRTHALAVCENEHCERIRALWDLRAHVRTWIAMENLTLEGGVLKARMRDLETLLRLDYEYVTYTPPSREHASQSTMQVFALLDLLRRFQRHVDPFQQSRLDGGDLYIAMCDVVESLKHSVPEEPEATKKGIF